MVEPFLEVFDLGQTMTSMSCRKISPGRGGQRLLGRLDKVLEAEAPDWVIVQGDTTTAASRSLTFTAGLKSVMSRPVSALKINITRFPRR